VARARSLFDIDVRIWQVCDGLFTVNIVRPQPRCGPEQEETP
jgi:hypothetical protein